MASAVNLPTGEHRDQQMEASEWGWGCPPRDQLQLQYQQQNPRTCMCFRQQIYRAAMLTAPEREAMLESNAASGNLPRESREGG